MITLCLAVCSDLHLVDISVVSLRSHPLEFLVTPSVDVPCPDVGRKVDDRDLDGGALVSFGGSFCGSHTETLTFGTMGEGLEVVFIYSAVKKEGSCPGVGYPYSLWFRGDLPEFSGDSILSSTGPSITRGGILGDLVLFSAGAS